MPLMPCGENAILITLPAEALADANRRVHAIARAVLESRTPGLGEPVPGYNTLLVYYDPLVLTFPLVERILTEMMDQATAAPLPSPRRVVIPVLYGGEGGPDLSFVAHYTGLTEEEVVDIHTAGEYPVYMMGFTPGFPYLGGMDPRIAAPRLETPRTRVPGGSVGIAGQQTGVYPIDSPGGWRIIGRTKMKLFDPLREPTLYEGREVGGPFLLAPGDLVRFRRAGDTQIRRRWPSPGRTGPGYT